MRYMKINDDDDDDDDDTQGWNPLEAEYFSSLYQASTQRQFVRRLNRHQRVLTRAPPLGRAAPYKFSIRACVPRCIAHTDTHGRRHGGRWGRRLAPVSRRGFEARFQCVLLHRLTFPQDEGRRCTKLGKGEVLGSTQ